MATAGGRNASVMHATKTRVDRHTVSVYSDPSKKGTSSWSTTAMSFVNLFMILPTGVVSKNLGFARSTVCSVELNTVRDAPMPAKRLTSSWPLVMKEYRTPMSR